MDIGKLVNYDDAVDYELKNPVNGEGLGVFFKLRHKESTVGRTLVKDHLRKNAKVMGKDVSFGDTFEMTEKHLLSCVVGWDWNGNSLNGVKDPEFNPANVQSALDLPWIYVQVNDMVTDIENFMKG